MGSDTRKCIDYSDTDTQIFRREIEKNGKFKQKIFDVDEAIQLASNWPIQSPDKKSDLDIVGRYTVIGRSNQYRKIDQSAFFQTVARTTRMFTPAKEMLF